MIYCSEKLKNISIENNIFIITDKNDLIKINFIF